MPGGFHPPKEVMATWPLPNYIDPIQKGPGVIVIAIVFGSLMLLVAGTRLFVRFRILREPGLDDYLIAVAMVRNLAHC